MDNKTRIENTAEQIIENEIGLKPGRSLLTPMDYGECLRCIEKGITAEQERSYNKGWNDAIEACKKQLSSTTEVDKILESLKIANR